VLLYWIQSKYDSKRIRVIAMGDSMSYNLEDDIPLITVKTPSIADECPNDWQRGYEWGRYNKSRRDPEMVAMFLKTFEPRNAFDRGYAEGLSYGH
jgi:hypothetical protein